MNTLMDTTASDLDAWAGIASAQAAGGTAVDERGVIATFYDRHLHQPRESELTGSVVMKAQTYVKIVTPADLKNVPDRPALETDYTRFPAAYARYKARETGIGGGTPLRDMVWMRPEALARLKVLKIEAVEQLANVSDDMAKKIGMGARLMITKARQQLEGDDVAIQELRRANATANQAVESMRAEMAIMKAQLAGKKPPRRRRRTKAEMETARAVEVDPETEAVEMPPGFAGGETAEAETD